MVINQMNQELMPNFLKKRAFLTPDRIALYFDGQALSFKDLYDKSFETAGRLTAFGVKKKSFTGILLTNHIDTVFILFALQLIGARAVMLNNRLSARELEWQLKDSKTDIVIADASFSVTESLKRSQLGQCNIVTKEELWSKSAEIFKAEEEIDLADICTIMYTSGTTGNPKGVIQTYGNHWWSATGSALNLGIMDADCWLCAVPIFHISGFSILMRSVIYGMSIVLHESFDVLKTLSDIEQKRVTIMSVVTTMLTRITDYLNGEHLPAHFRCMLLGGGPAPLPLLETCADFGIPVFQSYGMTETSSQIVTLAPEYSLAKLGSAGKTLFPSEIKILTTEGKNALPGEAGEITVKGPNVTPGYLYREDATKEKFRNGWLHTGDIGYLDEEGFLFVLDRRDDLIISGGENIYPAELEGILLGHSAVKEAGVIGIPDEKWGQVPAAYVVIRKSADVTEEELIEFCSTRMARYKVPKEIHTIEELPRNAAKKLLRRKLRELWEAGREK